jgi:hypothetical protein
MSQKSSLPQVIQFVSEALMPDSNGAKPVDLSLAPLFRRHRLRLACN